MEHDHKPPNWLGKVGKAKWRSLIKQLVTLREQDADALALLCKSWETYLRAQEAIDASGINVIGPNGMMRANPAIKVSNDAWKEVVKLSKEFGLMPDRGSQKEELGDIEL